MQVLESRLKIRLFALAKEMELDSKELIQICNDAGVEVKNSLATLTAEQAEHVKAYHKTQGKGGKPAANEPPTPVREAVPLHADKKIRELPTARRVTAAVAEETDDGRGAPAAVIEQTDDTRVAATGGAATKAVVPLAKADTQVGIRGDGEVAEMPIDSPPAESTEEAGRSAVFNRSEYVAPTGSGLSGIREMRARGNVREGTSKAQKKEKDKGKKPALPNLAAAPSFKPQDAPIKAEGPVQKPDLAITGDILKQSHKLVEILKQRHKETTGRGPRTDEEEAPGKGAKAGAGLGLTQAREERRRRRQKTRVGDEEDDVRSRHVRRQRRGGSSVVRKTEATVAMPATIRTLSDAMGRPVKDLLSILFTRGQMMTINDAVDEELAIELAMELGVDLTIEREQDVEDVLAERLEVPEGMELLPRPPIVTILGHVDHGKTTLIDRIRSANVAAGEAGGITQHIAAYQVQHDGQTITFVDTPGHAAFGEMRARGANVTDIVVLVVAADDGVMPQTVECIAHAKAANVPIVVAMNKIDLPGANEQKVLTDLSHQGLLPAEWGGETEVVRTSAINGTGIDKLLETLSLTAELNEYQTAHDMEADGVCLEAFRDEGRGPLAWLIVQKGTLKVGDVMLCGTAHGKVRAIYNDRDEEISSAGPSTPVKVAGFDQVPAAGQHFYVLHDLDLARDIAELRHQRGRTEQLSRRGGPRSLEDFFAHRDGGVQTLPVIVKADTPGSIEALRHELERFEHPEVKVKLLHEGVGGVNESDVYLAASSGAIIVAFHVVPEDRAMELAQKEGVEIRRYNIIYNVTDEIRQALEGMLKPERLEVMTGRAIVLKTFSISRMGTIAGCRVLNGTIERNHRIHVIRDQKILNDYPIGSLKREKDDVREVREGFECGIRLEGFNDVKEGDLLEAFKIEERKRSLDE
jgi:translation initiation factor IF-2